MELHRKVEVKDIYAFIILKTIYIFYVLNLFKS